MNKKVIIVGGVAGGATTAARLRRLDENAEIILFERGKYISYANCGLPYHVGDVIPSREDLLLQTPESLKSKFNIDVRIQQEVTFIDRSKKTVSVKNLATSQESVESYDTLVLATGSSPIIPNIPGIRSKYIFSLWTVDDADHIRQYIRQNKISDAIIIGGGFIGIEMTENLRRLGITVSLVEMLNQVMAPFDFEMAQLIHKTLEENGVSLYLGNGVTSFTETDESILVNLSDGKQLATRLVILSIGVKPNSELARSAGLALNARGGIVVDKTLRTSDPDIFAVGDVIEVEDFISKGKTMIPLAGPANKQGRIAAGNIAGENDQYPGTQGSAIVKIFDVCAANTGANEKTLLKNGLIKGKDYEKLIILQNSHAGYYPGASPMAIKLLFSTDGNKIFGAQIIGKEGVDKRIDTIGTAIRLGGTIWDLKSLEFAYAPPFSSAKDPVNMAGFVAENILKSRVFFAEWDVVERHDPEKTILLDVREDAERRTYALSGALNIPLGQIRSRLSEIDKEKEIIIFCAMGVRAYNAARILMANGFQNVKVYPGGMRFFRATHYK
ncbi:MAG TPA: FAD-dependent oxidoreductase [Flexilinea sp.]|jgi:NADPH-dependent 2,4-dienoyl-CoA reductase/sulfur reductase-like enzyme/rhodanese-related sulfurtransferase|nr:FAD-dependent oxidoreductase [Flexilinea sp.]HPJ65251.1 FAD-dependent oxidoreductase [Flexilinea sp.]HPR71779.1 FAD-dependent oxidoreductase [Flexilinea sp.]HQF80462.1 FAD-dependent oxidoreductase [Flexilinea sp.]